MEAEVASLALRTSKIEVRLSTIEERLTEKKISKRNTFIVPEADKELYDKLVVVRKDIVKRTGNTYFNLVFNANKLIQMMKCESLETMKMIKGIGEKNMQFLPEFFAIMKPPETVVEEEISIESDSPVAPPVVPVSPPVAPAAQVSRNLNPPILKSLKKKSRLS
jgi:hypothetical protein